MTQEQFYQRIWFSIVTALVVCVLVWLLDALRPVLSPFIVGILVAYLCDPLADRLERAGASRTLATSIITLSVFALLALLFVWVGPLLLEQLTALLQQLPSLLQTLQQWLHQHGDEWLTRLREQAPQGTPSNVDSLVGNVSHRGMETAVALVKNLLVSSAAFVSMASLLLITPIVTFYLLRDWDVLVARLNSLLPTLYAPAIRAQFSAIDATLAAYLRGQLHVMLILALYYSIALSVLSLPYALILALITGLLIIIPYVGTLISTALALGIAYTHFPDMAQVWQVAAVYGIGQLIEGQILTPKLIGDQVGLHPLWVLFGLLAGGAMFGFVGVLLAVPITAVIGVLVRFAVQYYTQQHLVVGSERS